MIRLQRIAKFYNQRLWEILNQARDFYGRKICILLNSSEIMLPSLFYHIIITIIIFNYILLLLYFIVLARKL